MSAARKCDKPGCPAAMDPTRETYFRVSLVVPFAKDGDDPISHDACSAECAHWLVDEHNEHIRR